jgi:hypothetical protein
MLQKLLKTFSKGKNSEIIPVPVRFKFATVFRIRRDPHSIGCPDPDPDPGGLKRAKMKGKNAAKRQIIRIKGSM